MTLEVPQGQVISYDLRKLCSALGVDDPTRVVVETDDSRRALVTIYPANPLAVMPPPSPDDMLMDRHGRIVVGRYHNGRPARRRLFDPSTGSAQRALVFGTTGAGKSRVVQYVLACEKRNRIVSWFADLKGGQSAPEAAGQVDWHATTQEEAILMLRAAVAIAEERQRRYKALGRNAFLIGQPDPLISVRIDEANRLLERGSPYREEATRLIKELGRTGRSVGVGVELDAQASHLEELGGSDTLRAMLKEGEVTLLRWSSSMMRQLVGDGLLPADAQLMPIPKTLRPHTLVSQFDPAAEDEDDAPGTQGTAYLLSGPHPTSMMRHFRIGSIAPTPGLDPEILALYGPGEPARLEDASRDAAGAAYAARNDPAAMEKLCAELRDETEKEAKAVPPLANGKRKPSSRLEDRVLAALAAFEGPSTADEVLAAVSEDGGKAVRLGSVRNALGALADQELVVREGHGLYALP
ncbi:transfer protein [Herbidospora sp. NEAU-GS84]|uniref:Transfer protein n=1 Tax=Herbidospora solisilvae TaxID=2696284 RepID=A0A7C9NGK6_9ACTN|nr:transfer protein [Herbidospora solisilvae]